MKTRTAGGLEKLQRGNRGINFTDGSDFESGIRGWRDAGQPVEHSL